MPVMLTSLPKILEKHPPINSIDKHISWEKTWEYGEKYNFGPDFGWLGPRIFFAGFTSTAS